MRSDDHFLASLNRAALERLVAARYSVPMEDRCIQCSGTGSVERYVLPGVIGPDVCKSCQGSGREFNERNMAMEYQVLEMSIDDDRTDDGHYVARLLPQRVFRARAILVFAAPVRVTLGLVDAPLPLQGTQGTWCLDVGAAQPGTELRAFFEVKPAAASVLLQVIP